MDRRNFCLTALAGLFTAVVGLRFAAKRAPKEIVGRRLPTARPDSWMPERLERFRDVEGVASARGIVIHAEDPPSDVDWWQVSKNIGRVRYVQGRDGAPRRLIMTACKINPATKTVHWEARVEAV